MPQATQKGGMAAEKEAAERQKKHTECAVPTGTNFLRSGKFQKDLILFVVRCYFGALIRGLENLESPCEGVRIVTFCVVQKVTKKHTECAVPAGTNFLQSGKFQKVLILLEGSRHCGELNRGLRNLGAPCKGERVVTFCVVQKVTKKHTGRSPATHDSNRRSIRF